MIYWKNGDLTNAINNIENAITNGRFLSHGIMRQMEKGNIPVTL